MKLVDKLLAEGIFFMIVFAVYMIWGDKEIICKNFWRTYFWIMIYLFPMLFFATLLPYTYNDSTFIFIINLAVVIFLGELVIFNGLSVNKDQIKFAEFCTSQIFGYVFSGSIALVLIIGFIVKYFK
jgi:hypothetical protein